MFILVSRERRAIKYRILFHLCCSLRSSYSLDLFVDVDVDLVVQ